MVEADPLDGVERQPEDGARRGRLLAAGRLDPGLGDGAEVGDEVAGRAVRLAPRPGGRQLGQAREAEQPLGDLGLGGEEALAAQADALDQPPHEDVGAALLHRRRGGAVELEEGLDPLARLGLELGAVERRLAAGDHVELAPPGDRRQPRQVAGAQLDRRPGQRPRRGGGVVGVGEHPQPGDRVAHLGPLEERRRPGEVEGDAALLHRRGDRAALAGRVGDEDADRVRGGAAGEQVLDLARDRLRLGALVGARQKRSCGLAEALLEHDHVAVGVEVAEADRRGRVGRPRARRAGSALSPASASSSARWAGVVSSSSSTIRCAKRAAIWRAHVGPLGEQAVEGEEDVAAVEAAGLGEDPVVGGVELGELELAAERLALGLARRLSACSRPARRGWSGRPVRPSARRSAPAGGRAGRPGCRGSRAGAAAARRGGRAASPAARPARARRRRGRARRPRRARAAAARRSRPRCRSRAPRKGRRAAPRRVRAAAARSPGVAPSTSTRSGSVAVGGEAGQAPRQQLGLAGAGGAEHQQRPVAVRDDALALARLRAAVSMVRAHHPTLARP